MRVGDEQAPYGGTPGHPIAFTQPPNHARSGQSARASWSGSISDAMRSFDLVEPPVVVGLVELLRRPASIPD